MNPAYWIVALFELAGILTAIRALMRARTSEAAIAWSVSLILMPYVAVPVYWLLGRSRFFRDVRAYRASHAARTEIEERVLARMQTARDEEGPLGDRSLAFEELGRHPATRGNRLEVLVGGHETYEAIFRAIEGAREYILIEFFILRHDRVGDRLKDLLIERSRAGVRCSVLYDEVGSRSLRRRFTRELEDAGVAIHAFSSSGALRRIFQINFRNHRKIVVVDGKEAFIGGFNVGEEYLGLREDLSPWRDTHLRVTGPTLLTAQLVFLEDWQEATQSLEDVEALELDWSVELDVEADMSALTIPSGPADERETGALMVLQTIQAARRRIWIASPYIVPDAPTVKALQLAALRGIEVRLLLPERSDAVLADRAVYTFYEELLPYGVEIYRYRSGFMHQKVMLVDDWLATIGTANFDNRSFRLNFEITTLGSDPAFVRNVEAMLRSDLERSRLVSSSEWLDRSFAFRFGCRLARLSASLQ